LKTNRPDFDRFTEPFSSNQRDAAHNGDHADKRKRKNAIAGSAFDLP
jgi:hypothetical protein